MSILLDLLGALMIATLLLLMMITFQMQLRDTADRTIFAAQMMTHVQTACRDLNGVIAMAGIKVSKDATCVTVAKPDSIIFTTYWDYVTSQVTDTLKTIKLVLQPLNPNSDVGRQLDITQGTPTENLGSILWLEEMKFIYYSRYGNLLGDNVTNADSLKNVYSVDINMSFKRDPPNIYASPLRTKIQLRCYMMNRYLALNPH